MSFTLNLFPQTVNNPTTNSTSPITSSQINPDVLDELLQMIDELEKEVNRLKGLIPTLQNVSEEYTKLSERYDQVLADYKLVASDYETFKKNMDVKLQELRIELQQARDLNKELEARLKMEKNSKIIAISVGATVAGLSIIGLIIISALK